MPRKNQPRTPYAAPKFVQDEVKPAFFSEKFRKSDLEKVKELSAKDASWYEKVIDALPQSVTLSTKWSEQNECWQTSATFPLKAEGENRKGILIGRGSSRTGSLIVVAYWYSTLTIPQLFPADDDDEEALI